MSLERQLVDASTIPPFPTTDGVAYRHIPGFTGYCAGSDGSVWSCLVPHKKRRKVAASWHRKKMWQNVDGYYLISMRDDRGKERRLLAHTAVLLAFVGPRPTGYDALHGDGNPSNNRIENLRWGTRKENMEDARRHGTLAAGVRNGNAKLSDLKAKAILDLQEKGWTQRNLAVLFDVSQPTVSAIKNGKRWEPENASI